MSAIISAIQPAIRSIVGSAFTLPSIDLTPEQVLMAIFAGGAKGAWYERSNLSSLFVENLGFTQPAVGGLVGLGLSREQGGGRGAERVVNGGFNTDLTGWRAGPVISGGGISWVSGKMRVTNTATGSNYERGAQDIVGLTVGMLYEIKADVSVVAGTPTESRITVIGVADIDQPIARTSPNAVFRATATTHTLCFGPRQVGSSVPVVSDWDNISVRDVPGNHQAQATASLKPLYQAGPRRLVFDSVDDVLNTTFPATLGANCTVIRAIPGTGVVITAGQTIGTSFADNVSAVALIIVDRALSAVEIAAATNYGNQQLAL